MRLDYPGIGGSLGQCVVCGDSFAMEVLMSRNVPMIGIEGFERDLPVHKLCLDRMEEIRGKGWEALPDGPLRKEYAEVFSRKSESVPSPITVTD